MGSVLSRCLPTLKLTFTWTLDVPYASLTFAQASMGSSYCGRDIQH